MICPICQEETKTHRGRGCPKRKRKSGKRKPRAIQSFDCETFPDKGIVLFLASGENKRPRYIYDPNGLDFDRIAAWMVESAGALNFGFFFDYDVNQIVALLPTLHKRALAHRGMVSYHGYRIRHTPHKRFSLTAIESGSSVTIWDCSGWAQCSFLKLCQNWTLGTETDRAHIARMKAARADLSQESEADLIRYTTLECALLSEWVRRILTLHDECGIALKAYSGPGSTASAMIRKVGWKPPIVPVRVQTIAEESFFGGRTEISSMGPVSGPIYSYDINSAYPRALARLPEIRERKWYQVRSHQPGMWGFYRVRWNQERRAVWGLFPMRGAPLPGGHRSVSLLYPRQGEGWFASVEVDNAIALCPAGVEIIDGWLIDPKERPFAWIEEQARIRLEYKRAGDERAFPLKVGLNSIYGKLAQHTGSAPLQSMAYASHVTAYARAELLKRAYSAGSNVILLATDGILSTSPLDCKIGSDLGEWELETYDSAWLLQAGVYWAGSKVRSRGIDGRNLDLGIVSRLWRARRTAATMTIPTRRVLSYRLCCAQNKPEQTGTWHTTDRTIRFSPEPRRKVWKWDGLRLLTLPADVDTYKAQVFLDQVFMDENELQEYAMDDMLPKWEQPE